MIYLSTILYVEMLGKLFSRYFLNTVLGKSLSTSFVPTSNRLI